MATLHALFNHFVLPPKLPPQQDRELDVIENAVLGRFQEACRVLESVENDEIRNVSSLLLTALQSCRTIKECQLEPTTLMTEFDRLAKGGSIILYIAEQNAALLIRRPTNDVKETVVFESFEASPRSETILAAEGALQWYFPGRAAEIPCAEFCQKSFQHTLSQFLQQASQEPLMDFSARARKAGVSVVESRNTPEPALISQFLLHLIEAIGSTAAVPLLRKRVRDDVSLGVGELPWRRLPFLLVLRVAIQRHFCLTLGNTRGQACYKFLMVLLLSRLLVDCTETLLPESILLLRAKVCKRLAKLETSKTDGGLTHRLLLDKIGPIANLAIDKATACVDHALESFKSRNLRKIKALPRRAPKEALTLSLSHSHARLQKILADFKVQKNLESSQILTQTQTLLKKFEYSKDSFAKFVYNYIELASFEAGLRVDFVFNSFILGSDAAVHCERLAQKMDEYRLKFKVACKNSPAQSSIFFLHIFECWAVMDHAAVQATPLLADYHPAFAPELLDCLQLETFSEMQRLRIVQDYLRNRQTQSEGNGKTIFTGPSRGCFASRFVQQCDDMKALKEKIERASQLARNKKLKEFEKCRQQYEEHTRQITAFVCSCTRNVNGRNSTGCEKCVLRRRRRKLRIVVHEDYLPNVCAEAEAVVFEMAIPTHLREYRKMTWKLYRMAHVNMSTRTAKPMMLLQNYSNLEEFWQTKRQQSGISLASVKKSWLQTHYKGGNIMEITKETVLLPSGLDYSYYDMESEEWLAEFSKLQSLEHACTIHIPNNLEQVIRDPTCPRFGSELLSSYNIVANQSKCPLNSSIHELCAYQRLLSGTYTRWPSILIELGSSNISFRTEGAMLLLTQLASQAGPTNSDSIVLGNVHSIFNDSLFCRRLRERLETCLTGIARNWREVYCMDMVISFALKLVAFADGSEQQLAMKLIEKAREITLEWTTSLREEMRTASSNEEAESVSKYGIYASILCRRTFAVCLESNVDIDAETLRTYVLTSTAIHEFLVTNVETLTRSLQHLVIRDSKMSFYLQPVIQNSIKLHPAGLADGINRVLSIQEDETIPKTQPEWMFYSKPYDRWVTATMVSEGFGSTRTIYFNYVDGRLLVNGEPLGRLLPEIRSSNEFRELFGSQHLITHPSHMPGMLRTVSSPIQDNHVHFGFDGDGVIIRALSQSGLYQFIPKTTFSSLGQNTFDLPLALIDNCVHWLNLDSGSLEIRRRPKIWAKRRNDWLLNVYKKSAQRKNWNKSDLVDVNSDFFKRIANIFCHFEKPCHLTVYQPRSGPIWVQIPRLELSFFVNDRGLLQCRELQAEIGPLQDAGTLYGLSSMILLRNVRNWDSQSILCPLGPITSVVDGIHVRVTAENTGKYGLFSVDTTLGRLVSAPEPTLLYFKALLHASTSFPIPDPLTGRTGAEEALYSLKSGSAQPWAPLNGAAQDILMSIQSLSPSRAYYPHNSRNRALQSVRWDANTTSHVQQDVYKDVVRYILEKSDSLEIFYSPGSQPLEARFWESLHLQKRAHHQRMLYQRDALGSEKQDIPRDTQYSARDRHVHPTAAQISRLVYNTRSGVTNLSISRPLRDILSKWVLIEGFCPQIESRVYSLRDLLESCSQEHWGGLINFCREAGPEDVYEVMLRLGLLAFSGVDSNVLTSLVALYTCDELRKLEPPPCDSFSRFAKNERPCLEAIQAIVETRNIDADALPQLPTYYYHKVARRIYRKWPWSCPRPTGTTPDGEDFYDAVLDEWERCCRNKKLSVYLQKVDSLSELCPQQYLCKACPFPPEDMTREVFGNTNSSSAILALPVLLMKEYPHALAAVRPLAESLTTSALQTRSLLDSKSAAKKEIEAASEELGEILAMFTTNSKSFLGRFMERFRSNMHANSLRYQYGMDLQQSLEALKRKEMAFESATFKPTEGSVKHAVSQIHIELEVHFKRIKKALSQHDTRFQWLQKGGLWPCTSTIPLLEQLRSTHGRKFGTGLKQALVTLGVLLTNLQQMRRLGTAIFSRDSRMLQQECYDSHETWDPRENPDWLLLELDGDFLIRAEQIAVARQTILPLSGENSVLQMNMGKGKTSVIMPLAAAFLSDGEQLSRIIVPKALLHQTAQTLQAKLGGLVGREVRHVPFSRNTPATQSVMDTFAAHHRDMLFGSGVMLSTPEHILSFKLGGLQNLSGPHLGLSQNMIQFQQWLTDKSRDILDESDVSLAVKTQLVYPSGPCMMVDGHPQRWKMAQLLLSLVQDHLSSLQIEFPRSIEVVDRGVGFPMIYILNKDVEKSLISRLIETICDGSTPFLQFSTVTTESQRSDVLRYFLDRNMPCNKIQQLAASFTDPPVAYKCLLLLRGLLTDQVLVLCLGKRWNVQYGLHPARDPVAVPFEAKGIPSERAEFGHPDVAIILTCLAFYYTGLSYSQFQDTLQRALQSDDPASEFEQWVSQSYSLPDDLRHVSAINHEDLGQVQKLWFNLKYQKNVLDYFMNHFVFPRHAKQFTVKLQASGWDLPLLSLSTKQNTGPKTTGFSGTNDNKLMLPLTIRQKDPDYLRHTSAEVLNYLLQPRNKNYVLANGSHGRWTETGLLQAITEHPNRIRVFLDAGAYIMEMDNASVVKSWMTFDIDAKAGVYFGANDQLLVQYRGSKDPLPLVATPFARSLEECVVYLDEAHTRGVDLKLSPEACGALTLALGQTKDHTVQAAMRLRQLGSTQSVVFIAPPEVHQSILDICKPRFRDALNSSHVVYWLLEQTCRANENLMPLYLSQGADFCRRLDSQWKVTDSLHNDAMRRAFIQVIEQPEQLTLEQLYGNVAVNANGKLTQVSCPHLVGFSKQVQIQKDALVSNAAVPVGSAFEVVEQEREVEFQVEEQRQLQKPLLHKPFYFPGLHDDIDTFVKTGRLEGIQGVESAWTEMARTNAGIKFALLERASPLFLSAEFMRTVDFDTRQDDNFIRPVEWILWSQSTQTAIVIITEEAEALIPRLTRMGTKAKVHLITYAAPITRTMVPLGSLKYYAIPSLPADFEPPGWLTLYISILAGASYMDYASVEMYKELLDSEYHAMRRNMAGFLTDWLPIRRRGLDVTHTPVGYVCQKRPLHEKHPFFSAEQVKTAYSVGHGASNTIAEKEEDSEDEEDECYDAL